MRTCRLFLVVAFLPVITLAQRVALIDSSTQMFSVADLETGKVEKEVKLTDPPTRLALSPDKTKFVVISRGTGKKSFIDEFLPTTRGSVTVIDASTFEVLGRAETGFGEPGDYAFSRDSKRIYITSSGALKNKTGASVHAVDLTSAKKLGEVAWARACGGYPDPRCGMAVSSDGKSAALFFHGRAKQDNPTMMKFVDLETIKESRSIDLVARTEPPVILQGQDTFYLLDNPLSKPGTIHAVSFSKQELIGKLTVGGNAKIAAADPEKNLIVVTGQTTAKGVRGHNGQLQAFRGVEEIANTKTVDYPIGGHLTRDGRKFIALSDQQIGIVDTESWKSEDLDSGISAHHAMLSEDESKYIIYVAREEAFCCGVGLFDIEAKKTIKVVPLSSTADRLATALSAIAASAESYSTAKADAKKSGKSSFTYSLYQPKYARARTGTMYVTVDNAAVWAIDLQYGGIWNIDLATGTVGKTLKPKIGASAIIPLAGDVFLTSGDTGINVVSVSTKEILADWKPEYKEPPMINEVVRNEALTSAVVLSKNGARGVTAKGALQPVIERSKNVVDCVYLE